MRRKPPHASANILELIPRIRKFIYGDPGPDAAHRCNTVDGEGAGHLHNPLVLGWLTPGNLLYFRHLATLAQCAPCIDLATVLLRMTAHQRRELYKKKDRYLAVERERPMNDDDHRKDQAR